MTTTSTTLPVFDYTSRDYASIYSDLSNRIPVYLPEWTSNDPSDFGRVLLQMFAYVGDLLGYYLDRLAGEAFLQTATQPSSVINLAAMLDYQPQLSVGASVEITITISSSVTGPYTVPAGSQFATLASPTQAPIVFETTEDLTIAGANAAIPSTTGTVSALQGLSYTSLPTAYWSEFGIYNSSAIDPTLAVSTGSSNQLYPLPRSPISSDTFSVYVDLGTGPQEWTYVSSLIDSGPYDQVYTNFVDANGIFYIVFGDGVNGYIPPLGSPVYASYQVNVGSTGNVGPGTINSPVSPLTGVVGVINEFAASGGADAESLASIRQNAPASLKTLKRAITTNDIETLTQQVSGVLWASAEEATYQLVNLYVAPYGGGAPSSVLQSAVLNYVLPLSLANTTITIFAPTYVPINVTLQVVVLPTYGNSTTQAAVLAAITDLLDLSNTGFGYRVALGTLYQTVLAVEGVEYAIISSLYRQELAQLTAALTYGEATTYLNVSPLPEQVTAGDTIVITNLDSSPVSQTLTASQTRPVGSTLVYVNSFTVSPTSGYPVSSTIQDTTGAGDCVMLGNEIPVLGTVTFAPPVSGGLIGS